MRRRRRPTLHHAVKDKRVTVLGPVKQPEMDFMSHRGQSTGRSGRQKVATRRNMRREERVTVQGPVKEQQPDGMSHRGGGWLWVAWHCWGWPALNRGIGAAPVLIPAAALGTFVAYRPPWFCLSPPFSPIPRNLPPGPPCHPSTSPVPSTHATFP